MDALTFVAVVFGLFVVLILGSLYAVRDVIKQASTESVRDARPTATHSYIHVPIKLGNAAAADAALKYAETLETYTDLEKEDRCSTSSSS